MSNYNKSKGLNAKIFCSVSSVGPNLLDGWEARPLSYDQFLVKRSNGTEVLLSIGDELDSVGLVSLDKNNNLSVGKWTVTVGVNIIKGWEARKTKGAGNYLIKDDQGNHTRVKVGENFEGLGLVGEDGFGNVTLGDKSVRQLYKDFELNLIVLKGNEKGGIPAYFNYLEPNNSGNRRDGAKGVFYPSKDGKQPSKFSEYGEDGRLYSTAVFFPSRDKKYLFGKVRSLDDAVIERVSFQKVKDLEEDAKHAGISPDSL